MAATDLAGTREIALASKLAGEPLLRMSRIGGGRNSRVFRVETADRVFALKQYPSLADDPRDRLGVETKALRWMAKHEVDVVPRVIATDAASNSALLSWAEGAVVGDVGRSDMDQAMEFLRTVNRLSGSSDFTVDHLASEACLSAKELERQIRKRMANLGRLEEEPILAGFLTGEFALALEEFLADARKILSSAALSFELDLAQSQRRLVPSDFGFHNALRDERGRLTFIDFEYFGWDDPVKLTADLLLHPGTPVAEELRIRLRSAAEMLYGEDPHFPTRLNALFPLFGLRWVLILLNEFHLDRWRRRVLAGAGNDWAEAKDRQLGAARAMLMDLRVPRRSE